MIEAQFEETRRHKSGSQKRSLSLKRSAAVAGGQLEEPKKNLLVLIIFFGFLYLASVAGGHMETNSQPM